MRIPFTTKSKPKAEQREMYVLSTGDLVSGAEYRSATENRMQRAISSGTTGDVRLLAAATALSVPAMVCVNYHSNVVASIPIVVNDEHKRKADFIPMKWMLENRMRWLIWSIDKSISIWGYALVRKHYNANRVPTLLEFLHPDNVRIDVDSKQNITGYRLNREQVDLLVNEVIYISGFDLMNTGNPTSKLENAFAYVGLERNIVTHAGSFFFNGASIAGVLTIEGVGMDDAKMDAIEKKFKKRFTGSKNAYKFAILEQNVKYTPLSVAPVDLGMSELSDSSKQFVCAAFGVNPALVGLGDVSDQLSASSTYDATKRSFIDAEATPSLDLILDALNTQWSLTDFSVPLLLISDSSAMAMMNDGISSEDAGVSNSLSASTVWTFEESRAHVGYDSFPEDDFYISRDPVHASSLYDDGTITLNQKLEMLGLKPVMPDTIRIDNITYLATDRQLVAQKNLEKLEAPAPSPFGLSLMATPQLTETTPNPPTPSNGSEIRSNEEVVIVEGIARQLTPRLVIGVDLADHQLIRLARRELGRELAEVNGITWVAPEDWRVELAHIDKWQPADMANMTRVIKWDFNRTEVWTGEYFVNGNGIYLSLGDTDATEEIARLVHDDLRSVEIKSNKAVPAMAVKLAHGDVTEDMIPKETSLGSMPVVFTRIAAYANNRIQHKWRLRAYLNKDNQELLGKQRDELSKWQQRVARSGFDDEWVIDCLPDHVVRFLIGDDTSPGMNEIVEFERVDQLYDYYYRNPTVIELFGQARRMLTVRALQALRLDFENFVQALLTDTRNGDIDDRTRFGNLLRGEMARFGRRAYLDGLTDGGVTDATLSDSDDKQIKTMLSEQSGFVSNLSQLLIKGDGISDAQAAQKPAQWWAGSIHPFYLAGFKSAGANPMMEFVGAFGADPCATCRHLFGQRHRFNIWERNGLGMVGGSFVGQNTICGEGGHCKHSIVTVIGRARGSLRSDDMSDEVRKRLDEIKAVYDIRSDADKEELRLAIKKKFSEEDVNRDPDGKFGTGTGGSGGKDGGEEEVGTTGTELEENAEETVENGTSSSGVSFIPKEQLRDQNELPENAINSKENNQWLQGLTNEGQASLNTWTESGWSDFQDIALGEDPSNFDFGDEFESFEAAIEDAPKYSGTSWRGVAEFGDRDAILSKYQNSDNLTFDTYSSATASSSVGGSFSKVGGSKARTPVLFEIYSNEGRYIANAVDRSEELEVVFKPNSNFKVKDAFIGSYNDIGDTPEETSPMDAVIVRIEDV